MITKRLLMLFAAITLVAVACGGGAAGTTTSDDAGTTTAGDAQTSESATDTDSAGIQQQTLAALPEGPSALQDRSADEYPDPLIDPSEIISGGPPPDGIPPVDDPQFVSVDEADGYLADAEPIVWLDIDGDVRAYPVQILIWHEIVNDTVGGVPVAITYCPLCNSAVTYIREIRGVETTFGTSGSLFASALVMYDRATETLWTHFDGTAVVGLVAGEQLDPVPSPLISWGDFKAAHPDAQVLDRDRTGASRPYGDGPYAGYDNPDSFPFLFRGDADSRARAMERVAGVELDGTTKAWTFEYLSDGNANATHDTIGGTEVVLFWKAGQASALDTSTIEAGRDVGSVTVFIPRYVAGELTFFAEDGRFFDNQTGSEWSITGEAVSGELAGTRLEAIHHLDTFWFAWSTYQPGTELIDS